ncbi:cytochrome P450 [Aspergillus carlsbadensis]|nr:cytochrome P450 [Aspergillus carlsbadensis]
MLLLISACFVWACTSSLRHRRKQAPGPRPLPLIGNLHQIPLENRWRKFQQWHKAYGPIIQMQLGQRLAISVGSHTIAHELLNVNGSIYSSRPRLILAGDCISKGLHSFLLPYGDKWPHPPPDPGGFVDRSTDHGLYRHLQDMESKQLLYDLLSATSFRPHFRRYTASIIFTLAYGKRMATPDAPEIIEVDQIIENLALAAGQAENMIVEAFPILHLLPSFLAPWKRVGDRFHERTVRFFNELMDEGRQSPAWNWTKHVLGMKEARSLESKEIAYLIGGLYEAGSETTATVLEIFVFAAVLHPECVRRAQSEIDSVTGKSRPPSFDDAAKLPYTNAFINEVLRWRPGTPLGLPHAPIRDSKFMGYDIPAGTMIFPNNWALDLDDEVFQDPFTFRPERWLLDAQLPLSTFGFGRRACAGNVMARNSLFIVISRVLWEYDITPVDEGGTRVEVDPWAMKQGITSPPLPFPARFSVRSAGHSCAIEREWESAEKDAGTTFVGKADATARD